MLVLVPTPVSCPECPASPLPLERDDDFRFSESGAVVVHEEASHKLHKSVYVKICRLPQGTSSELTLRVCGRCRILCENLAISVNGVGPKGGDDASM